MRFVLGSGAVAAVMIVSTTMGADAREVERECSSGRYDVMSLDAEFESWVRSGKVRRYFDMDLDIERTKGFSPGQIVRFDVRGRTVAERPLVRERDGDLAAEIVFRSWRSGAQAFPPGFPRITRGTLVSVSVDGEVLLRCRLR